VEEAAGMREDAHDRSTRWRSQFGKYLGVFSSLCAGQISVGPGRGWGRTLRYLHRTGGPCRSARNRSPSPTCSRRWSPCPAGA